MVIADSDSPGPLKKRPRLSLKFMKQGGSKDADSKLNSTEEKIDEELTDAKNSCDEVKTVQELAMAGEDNLLSNEDESVVPAVASLENLGNTCFLNSILQVLRYTPRFLEGLEDLFQEIINVEKLKKQEAAGKEDASSSDANDSFQTIDIVKFLYKLYKEMERREEKHPDVASSDVMSMALKPEKLLNSLRDLNPMFEGNLQHDAQELMRCILCYLQDAEKEIYKMKSSLPPRVLPQKGPTNPIMQKFLLGSRVSKARVNDSEKKEDENKFIDSKNDFQKPDILDEIERSEAAKTGGYKENADPKATDTAFVINHKDSLPEMSENGVSEKSKSESDQTTPNMVQDSEKNGAKKSRSSNARISDSRSRSASSTSRSRSNKKKETEEEPKSNSKVISSKRGRTKYAAEYKDEVEKRTKIEDSDSQTDILNMLKVQVNRKRLGMRGAVVKDNCNNNACPIESKVESKYCDLENQTPVYGKNHANRLAAFGINGEKIVQKKPKTEIESPRKSDIDNLKSNGDSPTKTSADKSKSIHPFIKLEKCDHVCNSPKKSVDANYAERTLSPMKSANDALTPQKTDSARKLSFSPNKCSPNKLGNLEMTGLNDRGHVLDLKNKFDSCKSPIRNRQLSPSKLTRCSPKKNKKDFVEKLFMGSMMLRTRCLECENSKERVEEFHDISVPLRKEKEHEEDDDDSDSDDESNFGLKKLMDAFTEVERLRDDNKYFCENCFRLVEAERSLHYEVLPDILTLHLKRFQASSGLFGYVSKINDHINIPIILPCLRYKCPSPCSRPDHRYRLYAVVTHAGVTLTAGHYLAYVRVIEASKLKSGSSSLSSISPTSARINSDKNTKSSVDKLSSFFDKQTSGSYGSNFGRKSAGSTNFISVPLQKYDSDWLECDDETIRVYREEKFKGLLTGEGGSLLGTPYVLFYHRVAM